MSSVDYQQAMPDPNQDKSAIEPSVSSIRVFSASGRVQAERTALQRSMQSFPYLIAIDGGAATGKSALGENLAKEYGCVFLDTGQGYRAVAAIALHFGVAPDDVGRLREIAASLEYDWTRNTYPIGRRDSGAPATKSAIVPRIIFTKDNSVTSPVLTQKYLKPEHQTKEEIGMLASQISKIPDVRQALLPLQRSIGTSGIVVGRDAATEIFPEADMKILVDVDLRVKAERRALQDSSCSKSTILRLLEARDKNDQSRAVAPLATVDNAYERGYHQILDNTFFKSAKEFYQHAKMLVDLTIAVKEDDSVLQHCEGI